MKFFHVTSEESLKELKVDASKGLSSDEAKRRLEQYGANEFTKKEEESLLDKIKDALMEPMMIILLAAALISLIIGHFGEAIGIVAAVAIGIAIGIITEGQSAKAAEALAKMSENIPVKALRNGEIVQINKSDLVPGDIIFIETGDQVPADARLLESIDLKVREDMLTGESDDIKKNAHITIAMEVVEGKDKTIVQDPIPAKQLNMLFGGTLVAYGKGKAVITATGDASEMGKIAQNLEESDLETPLQQKLGGLGTNISKVATVIAIILFIIQVGKLLYRGQVDVNFGGITPFLKSINSISEAFVICVALIVAAVPEGLPTMINMTLAITMQKMAKINALVRKKEACETIGSVSVICSDKTGTLTQNRMTVEKVFLHGKEVSYEEASNDNIFIDNCLLNSTADIEHVGNEIKYLGSATECALLLYHKDRKYIEYRNAKHILHQFAFSSDRKRMSTVVEENGKALFLTKGAPEVILHLCKYEEVDGKHQELTSERRIEILEEIKKLQQQSMRVIGFGYKTVDIKEAEASEEADLEKEVIFIGFVGIKDPLRPDVKESVELARKAGVQTKMLTGDNINTAVAIGTELGLLEGDKKAVEATYIDTLNDDELREEIKHIAIVARSKPDTKMRIVQALQTNGEVIAVTGDGINDAPALTKADVGVAMGIAGTEVSKSAADIILTDDSFSTIVQAIKWGRGIYENFQRFIQFQLTVNFVAFLIAILSVIFDFDMPFTTIQLLWVNIIMDGPPALALGLEPVRRAVLNRKPTNRNANIITKLMLRTMIANALYITAILVLQIKLNILQLPTNASAEYKETVLFGIFAFSALFNAFNCREFGANSIIPNLLKNKIFLYVISITGLAQLIFTQLFSAFFDTVPLDVITWLKVLGLAALVIVVNEIVKFVVRLVK